MTQDTIHGRRLCEKKIDQGTQKKTSEKELPTKGEQ
jgi:hypothetical protein